MVLEDLNLPFEVRSYDLRGQTARKWLPEPHFTLQLSNLYFWRMRFEYQAVRGERSSPSRESIGENVQIIVHCGFEELG